LFGVSEPLSSDYFASGGADNLAMVWKTNFDKSMPNNLFENNLAPPLSAVHTYAGIEEDQMADRMFKNAKENPTFVSQSGLPKATPPVFAQGKPQIAQSYSQPNTSSQVTTSNMKQVTSSPVQAQPTGSANFQSVYFPPPLQTDTMSPNLSNTLEHILRQLDIITQTVKVMEDRLTLTEYKLSKMESNQKKIIQMELSHQFAKQQQPSPSFTNSYSNPQATPIPGRTHSLYGSPQLSKVSSQSSSPNIAKEDEDYIPSEDEIHDEEIPEEPTHINTVPVSTTYNRSPVRSPRAQTSSNQL